LPKSFNRNPKSQIILEGLGDSAPPSPVNIKTMTNGVKTPEILKFQDEVLAKIQSCKSYREMLEMQLTSLYECVALADAIWREKPVPDNSYQLTALTNARDKAQTQLDKMKDPEEMLSGIEDHIKIMFTAIIKALALEIDKTKRELLRIYPDDQSTVEDLFGRMMNSVQPETQNIYDDLRLILKKILGIRSVR